MAISFAENFWESGLEEQGVILSPVTCTMTQLEKEVNSLERENNGRKADEYLLG